MGSRWTATFNSRFAPLASDVPQNELEAAFPIRKRKVPKLQGGVDAYTFSN